MIEWKNESKFLASDMRVGGEKKLPKYTKKRNEIYIYIVFPSSETEKTDERRESEEQFASFFLLQVHVEVVRAT